MTSILQPGIHDSFRLPKPIPSSTMITNKVAVIREACVGPVHDITPLKLAQVPPPMPVMYHREAFATVFHGKCQNQRHHRVSAVDG